MPTWAPIPMRTLSAPAWRPHGRHTPSGRRADPGERAARERANHVAAAAERVQRGAPAEHRGVGGHEAEPDGGAAAAAHPEPGVARLQERRPRREPAREAAQPVVVYDRARLDHDLEPARARREAEVHVLVDRKSTRLNSS